MSADNYYFVAKTDKGYEVSHRFASVTYADEGYIPMEGYGFTGDQDGWTINGDEMNDGKVFATMDEAVEAATRRPDWVADNPEPRSTHSTLEEAVLQAHKYVSEDYVVEYGVCVQKGLV